MERVYSITSVTTQGLKPVKRFLGIVLSWRHVAGLPPPRHPSSKDEESRARAALSISYRAGSADQNLILMPAVTRLKSLILQFATTPAFVPSDVATVVSQVTPS